MFSFTAVWPKRREQHMKTGKNSSNKSLLSKFRTGHEFNTRNNPAKHCFIFIEFLKQKMSLPTTIPYFHLHLPAKRFPPSKNAETPPYPQLRAD
jgi:hypothetical protein